MSTTNATPNATPKAVPQETPLERMECHRCGKAFEGKAYEALVAALAGHLVRCGKQE